MKAVILAGGTGSRLAPCTQLLNKHLLPIYDQPVIHHPLALAMRAGVRQVALVVTPEDESAFRRLLGNGEDLGIRITYFLQPEPLGVADALSRAEPFVADERFLTLLGDGLFLVDRLEQSLRLALTEGTDAITYACPTAQPEDFAVLELDDQGRALSIEEKPSAPRSNLVVPGLYVLDSRTFSFIRQSAPSDRGELEVTDVTRAYMAARALTVERLDSGVWLDLGTAERLADATVLVREWESRTGMKPGCPEQVAWQQGWINTTRLKRLGKALGGSSYGRYLLRLAGDA